MSLAAAGGLSRMPDYRLYVLDAAGHIGAAEWIEAKSDDEAIAFARGKKHGRPSELWDRNRLVATIPAHLQTRP